MKYNPNQPYYSLDELRHMSADLNAFSLVKQDGKISPSLSSQKWFLEAGTDGRVSREDLAAILNIFCRSPRGLVFKETQSSNDALRWCALVPLVLAAFKEYRNIGYAEWDWTDPVMYRLLDADLKALIPFIIGESEIEEFDTATRVEMIKETATVRSGKSAGTVKSPPKITTVTKVNRLNMYPRLLKLMILQCWVCHFSLRNQYMILDCLDLDGMPLPLVDVDIIPTTTTKPTTGTFKWE